MAKERNINVFSAIILKDSRDVYPDGCTRNISCNHELVKDEEDYVVMEPTEDAAGNFVPAGTVYTSEEANNVPGGTVEQGKVIRLNGENLWIKNYDASDCNGCCVPA
jgi:hypothetical protein